MKLDKIYYSILLPIELFLVSGTFFATPLQDFFFIIRTLLIILSAAYIFLFFIRKIIRKPEIDKTILILTLLSIFIPILSSIRANIEFGQPILLGIISERGWLTFGIALWVHELIINSKVKLKLIENSFLFLSTLPFIFYVRSICLLDFIDIAIDQKF